VGRFVVIGETSRVEGFALGGALVICADDPQGVREAWTSLPPDAAVVVLTARAAAVVGADAARHDRALVAVVPS
jgi:vacuolar-type H+-ATPase subunit F/Vma7